MSLNYLNNFDTLNYMEKALLQRRVIIKTLPLIIPSSLRPVKGPKRMLLEKGELAEFYDAQAGIRHIAYIEFPKGKTRGGHYHLRSEFFYVIRGKMRLKVANPANNTKASVVIREGDLIFITKKISHAITTLEPGHVIEFSEKRFNPKDTITYAGK
jgi:mannose-6-phosphate isomerase-like protein (cupin superfamily)